MVGSTRAVFDGNRKIKRLPTISGKRDVGIHTGRGQNSRTRNGSLSAVCFAVGCYWRRRWRRRRRCQKETNSLPYESHCLLIQSRPTTSTSATSTVFLIPSLTQQANSSGHFWLELSAETRASLANTYTCCLIWLGHIRPQSCIQCSFTHLDWPLSRVRLQCSTLSAASLVRLCSL